MTPIPQTIDRRHLMRQWLALCATACLPMAAQAHGDAHAKAATSDVVREQKPWGIAAAPAESYEAFDRSIDSRIVRLRRKLDSESIVTVRGAGYRFDPPKGA